MPLLKDNSKKKRLAWAKKHEQWTLERWKSVLWVQILDFWFQPQCLCEMQSRWTDDLRMCSSQREAWRRRSVMVWGCFAGDIVCDLFWIQGTLNQHGYHSILQRYAIPYGLRLVGLSFVFQQDNDPKHTYRLCKGYLTKKESDGVLHQMTWPPQSPDLNPIEMVWDELDHRVKEKQPTGLLGNHSRWSWLRECQECANLSSRQRVATLKNLNYKVYFDLFNIFGGYHMIPCVIS